MPIIEISENLNFGRPTYSTFFWFSMFFLCVIASDAKLRSVYKYGGTLSLYLLFLGTQVS